MCDICDDFKAKTITAEEAFGRIGDAMRDNPDDEKTGHLMDISNMILDEEVPLAESNDKLDQEWWDKTHPWDGHED